jgi:ferredoxin-like protein FixX
MPITTTNPPSSTPEAHAELEALLPWYANGTLTTDEANKVEQHLEQCVECQDELAQCRVLANAVQADPRHWQPPPGAFEKLMADIEQLEKKPVASTVPAPSLLQRIQAWFNLTPEPIRWTLGLETIAVAALLMVIATPGLRLASDYETLSSTTEQGTTAGPHLRIMFNDAATASEMQHLLLDIEANIVSGPTALGVYIVALPNDAGTAPSLSTILARLRAHHQIRLVEPIAPGGRQ